MIDIPTLKSRESPSKIPLARRTGKGTVTGGGGSGEGDRPNGGETREKGNHRAADRVAEPVFPHQRGGVFQFSSGRSSARASPSYKITAATTSSTGNRSGSPRRDFCFRRRYIVAPAIKSFRTRP